MFPLVAFAKQPSTLIFNETKDEFVIGHNLNVDRPIASLTKIMTAMVALDYDGNLQRKIKITGSNKIPSGEYTREELLTAMLVRSDNAASEAIANDYPGGRKAFIKAMNVKAEKIGMVFTKFVDPSGLSAHNRSTATSVGIMLQVSALYPFILDSSVKKQINIKKKNYSILLDNTNRLLLYDFDEIILSKTGFTSSSGWSVAMVLEKNDQRFSVVVLGAPTKEARYELAKKMILTYFQDLALEKDEKDMYNKTIWEKIKDWFYK
jgi:D-alanyl-D-alanine endopeptidase (penicillin-binding protein 7)